MTQKQSNRRRLRSQQLGPSTTWRTPLPAGGVRLETFVPWTVRVGEQKAKIVTPSGKHLTPGQAFKEFRSEIAVVETSIIRALGLALHWERLLDEGHVGSLTELAKAEGVNLSTVSRGIRLAGLAPAIMDRLLQGEDLGGFTDLVNIANNLVWEAQIGEAT